MLGEDGNVIINGAVLEAEHQPRGNLATAYSLSRLSRGDGLTVEGFQSDETMT
ncbi:hypothetical protein GRAN_4990 [Granulicella sibirica]|uniref:Uncharacterized protein n=1 Tax=Granulicella sibirica TaxID=2479048 RepID=A0A4Q0SXW3_9BACT|nr:hypothetical protein GRAN_4990 [Granulicella sibirica]